MTASASEIRAALCGTLINGCERGTSWFPYPLTELGGGNYPAGMIVWATRQNDYGDSFDPTDTIYLDVELHVRGEWMTASMMMDEYVMRGSGSAVVDALALDPTLDGLVTDATAFGFDIAPYQGPDEDFVGTVHLRVMT